MALMLVSQSWHFIRVKKSMAPKSEEQYVNLLKEDELKEMIWLNVRFLL